MITDTVFTKIIRDPLWKDVRFTPELYALTKSEDFLRLYTIKQLGPTELVYPGASHSRASHSIGVYHLARKVLKRILCTDDRAWVTEQGAYSFLVAALLHDLGHFPFTHSLKELDLKSHEELTAELVMQPALADRIKDCGADPAQTAAIIDAHLPASNETKGFRRILSGVLDPDKLDYLNRDAYYCGVPYGIQDTDFIISRLFANPTHGMYINSDSVMAVEGVLFAKYLMYRSVYWHRDVRIATAMMKKAVFSGLKKQIFSAEALYRQTDRGIIRLLQAGVFPEANLALLIQQHHLFIPVFESPISLLPHDVFALEDLTVRSQCEAALAEILSTLSKKTVRPQDVLIDIPERISFETNLWIADTQTMFRAQGSVFSDEVVHNFTDSLRIMRIAVHPHVYSEQMNNVTMSDIKPILIAQTRRRN